jgi:hypothetical protein
MWTPVERLRRIWTPNREVYELADSLQPSTELDSKIREYFSRVIREVGSIQIDVTDPVDGFIRFEEVMYGRRKIVAIWWLKDPDQRME